MFASFKKSVAVSMAVLTLGLAVVGASTPASAFWRGGGLHAFHGGMHHGWGYGGWRGGLGLGAIGVGIGLATILAAQPPCGIVYRPVFDAYGNNVGMRPVNTCE
jgi:hypothetical protein